MKKAKWILLVLAIPFMLVPTARANDGHDDGKEHKERKGHDDNNGDRGDRGDSDGNGGNHSSTRVPIDAGIGILILAGIGLGAKMVIDRNKKKAPVI
ncbi:MAG TPA: hypothetical protein VGZ71_02525 [Puia sp.]|jgi:hypothetical protein|nr:hypothetical protein [Puia sp.]